MKKILPIVLISLLLAGCMANRQPETVPSVPDTAPITTQSTEDVPSSRPVHTTLSRFPEGMEEIMEVTLYEGDHYSIYIPDGDWVSPAEEYWQFAINPDVSFWIKHYPGQTEDQVMEHLLDIGYRKDYGLTRVEADYLYTARIFSEDDRCCVLYTSYPNFPEYGEGVGATFRMIADSFAWEP